MFLVDYIIIFVTVISIFLGYLRGFIKEVISSLFWLFNCYFFYNYDYFSSFYFNELEDIFLKSKVLTIVIVFFSIKKILNYFLNKIINKAKLLYVNIILGGLFGLCRGLMLVDCFLFIFYTYNTINYNFYIKNSELISIFFYLHNYFILIIDIFLKN